MKDDFSGLWAEAPSTLRRDPNPTEIAGGFPCGPLDLQLFNELMFRLSQSQRELVYAIKQSGQTPNQNNTTQLWAAILSAIETYAPGEFNTYLSTLSIVGGRLNFYNSPGTYQWTCPTDVTKARVILQAGGGAGGGSSASTNGSGGAGGHGGNSAEGVYDVIPGTIYSVTVGAAGAGSLNSSGGNGGASSFGPQGSSAFRSVSGGGGGGPASGTNGGLTGTRAPIGSASFPNGGYEIQGSGAQNGFTLSPGIFAGGIGGGSRFSPTTAFPVGSGGFGASGFGGGSSGGVGGSASADAAPGCVILEY